MNKKEKEEEKKKKTKWLKSCFSRYKWGKTGSPSSFGLNQKTFAALSNIVEDQYPNYVTSFNLMPYGYKKLSKKKIVKLIFGGDGCAFSQVTTISLGNETFRFQFGACSGFYQKLQPNRMVTDGTLMFLQSNNNNNNNVYYLISENGNKYLLKINPILIKKIKKTWNKKYIGEICLGWKGNTKAIKNGKKRSIFSKDLPIYEKDGKILFENESPLIFAYAEKIEKINFECEIYGKEGYQLTENDDIDYGRFKITLQQARDNVDLSDIDDGDFEEDSSGEQGLNTNGDIPPPKKKFKYTQ